MSKNQVVTFGCRLNIFESEVIKEQLAESKLEDAIVFNSCSVTSEAERQLRQSIRKHRRLNPDKKIIVTGCAAQIDPGKYADMPEVDQVLGNQEKLKKNSYLDSESKVLVEDIMQLEETASHMVSSFEGKARAFLEIQNGCNHRCTFCIIPFGRGNNRSVPLEQIIEHTKKIVSEGYKEVVLTGVDITDYGDNLDGKPKLGFLIKEMLRLVPELTRIRLSSLDVAEIDDDLRELIVTESKLMPHFHLSLQAGDDMVLKRMKRRHNRQEIIDFCKFVREHRPNASIGADIIAGFPTEDEQMFNNSLELVKELKLPLLHIFPYSEREGTPAAKIPEDRQVPKVLRKQRAKALIAQGKENLAEYSKSFVGKKVTALVETEETLKTNEFLKVEFKNHGFKLGEVVEVEIRDFINDCLIV